MTTQQQGQGATALAKTEQQKALTGLAEYLKGRQGFLAKVAAKHLDSERMVRLALTACSSSPLLLRATPESIAACLMDCARLGLEPTGKGGVWLVPFKRFDKKTNRSWVEATAITDYRGELALARRSGQIKEVAAHAVYEQDEFRLEYGDEERLVHKPELFGPRGKVLGYYAIAKLTTGGVQRAFMTLDEVIARRDRSRAKDNGPWVTDFDAMALKTVIRVLCNLLPMSLEYREFSEREEARELVTREPPGPVVETSAVEVIEEAQQAAAPAPTRGPRAQAMLGALQGALETAPAPAAPEPPAEPEDAPEEQGEASEGPVVDVALAEEVESDFGQPPEPTDNPELNQALGELVQLQRELVEIYGGDVARAEQQWRRNLALLEKIAHPAAAKATAAKAKTVLKKARLAVELEGVTADARELGVHVPDLPTQAGALEQWSMAQLEGAVADRRRRIEAARAQAEG
jgi:recombination protein RecT